MALAMAVGMEAMEGMTGMAMEQGPACNLRIPWGSIR
jgi:hypothetical protein